VGRLPSPGASVGAGALLQLLRGGVPRTRFEPSALTGIARSLGTGRIDVLRAVSNADPHIALGPEAVLDRVIDHGRRLLVQVDRPSSGTETRTNG
jgi:hypothetical protein